MRRIILAVSAVAVALPATAQIATYRQERFDTRSITIDIPDPIASEAQLAGVRDDLLSASKRVCAEKYRSSAIKLRGRAACVAGTYESALESVPEGEVKAYLQDYFIAELASDLN
ncbi:MAG: hypothetical protein AAFX08_12125 [Pseudomonadota bacterium]